MTAVADVEALTPKNHRLKRLRRLVNQTAERRSSGAFVVEGPTLVGEALTSGLAVYELYAEVGYELSPSVEQAVLDSDVALHRVVSGALDGPLSTVTPQPVAAVVERPSWTLADLDTLKPVLVVIDGRDPGNVGALCRTAEAAGFAGLVLGGSSVDPTNPKVVRAGAGATLRLPLVVAEQSANELFDALRQQGRTVLATTVQSGADVLSHDQADLTAAAIVLGNEANGLDQETVARADHPLTIELAGPTESLNVAAAGAVLCFEALRQMRRSRRTDPVG